MGVVPGGVSGALRRRPRGDVLHAARALEARGRFGARRFQALLERAARAPRRLPRSGPGDPQGRLTRLARSMGAVSRAGRRRTHGCGQAHHGVSAARRSHRRETARRRHPRTGQVSQESTGRPGQSHRSRTGHRRPHLGRRRGPAGCRGTLGRRLERTLPRRGPQIRLVDAGDERRAPPRARVARLVRRCGSAHRRAERWAEVRSSIDRMSPLAKNDPAWIYWYGRAERELGSPLEAEGYFERIAEAHNFYGRLAAEELGVSLRIPARAPLSTESEIAEVAAIPGLARALALYRLDMRTEATKEWLWTIRGMDDRKLLAAAELARRNEAWDRAISTADKTVFAHNFSVRYLAPYREVLAEKARSRDLEEPWVLGVVRQESRFIIGAKSSAGATGLMQVMRPTAKWVAQRMRMKNFSWARLHEPDLNATLGTYYLKHVLNQFDGSPVLAAAAYNAGPSRARLWRGTAPVEGAIFVETIPFGETRDYVKKVMANTVYYAAVLGTEPTPLKTRLGMVLPRRSAEDVKSTQNGSVLQ
ncbi:MAG: lytic transglycosylase domain-containing protein [Betaproteobacteria bacterium]|nr:MAG: lytic transglycosylase domain-containing protein [Betaproteobacteria bacterium]